MTVSTELSHEEYTGNGVTTDFDFRFRIFEAKHLVVSVADQDGTERILTNGTDYTLRGVGSYRGGKVILKMPLATGWKIGIARDLPAVQETDLRNQGKFFAEVHEDAFDYLTMLIQKSLGYLSLCLRKPSFISDHYDAKGNKISNLGKPVKDGDAVDLGTMKEHINTKDKRSLRVADKDIPALPNVANRANKLLSFDDNGNPVVIVPESGSAADVLAELGSPDFGRGDSLIAVRQPFSGAVVRTQHDKNSDIVSSADVGVSSDDSTTQFTNLDSEGVSVLITSDEISVADDIPGTVHLSLKEITQSGAGAVPIRNLSRKNILPKNNKIYDVTTGYDFDYRQDNIIKNSTFFVWHDVTVGKKNIGMPTNLSASANAMICAFWRMETTANVTCGGISKISSPAGGLHFVATYGSTGGFVYLRQNINGVQAFGTKTFTACIDLEVNGNCEMDYYARMRINSSNDAALRPLIVDSENIDVISGRHRYAITFTCPDVDSFRGTENSQNSMEIAFRIHGAEQTLAVNVRGITVSPGSHIPHPMMSDPQKDVCDADVMYRIAPFGIGGFTDAIGQRRYAVDIGCLRYTAGSLSIYDMAGNSNVISTYSLDGKRTDNVPFTLTADNVAYGSFQLLLQSSTASGMAGWYVYNAYP